MTKIGDLEDFIEKSLQTQKEKICPRCGLKKPLTEEFWYKARPRVGHMKEGWQSNCRVCWVDVNRNNKLRRKSDYSNQNS